jgi:hypothetical protein
MAVERTLVAVFETTRAAEDAMQRLIRAGIPQRVLQLVRAEEASPGDAASVRPAHALLIARVPEAAAADLAQALAELGASRVDDGQPPGVPATDVSFEPFSETVFELPEFTEEAVAVKQPWVVEEVVLAKVVREHAETIRETLHKRDVSLENVNTGPS